MTTPPQVCNLTLFALFLALGALAPMRAHATHYRGGEIAATIASNGVVTVTAHTRWRKGLIGGTTHITGINSMLLLNGQTRTFVRNVAVNIDSTTVLSDTSNARFDLRKQVFQVNLLALSVPTGMYILKWSAGARVSGIRNTSDLDYSLETKVIYDQMARATPSIDSVIDSTVVRGQVFSRNLNASGATPLTYRLIPGSTIRHGPTWPVPGLTLTSAGQLEITALATTTLQENSYPDSPGADYVVKVEVADTHGQYVEQDFLLDATLCCTDLGVLPGMTGSLANAVNDRNEVAGASINTLGESRAFVWTPKAGMVALGTLGGSDSNANGINNLGQVVGDSRLNSGVIHGFIVTPLDSDGDGDPDTWFRDLNGDGVNDLMQDLGTLVPGDNLTTVAQDINDVAQVVGRSVVPGFPGTFHAFLWEAGDMDDLGDPGVVSQALGINDLGQAVGHSGNPSGYQHAFIWEAGNARDLGTLTPNVNSAARDINNRGQIVGEEDEGAVLGVIGGNGHALLWPPTGGVVGLGNLSGAATSRALGINDFGQIVGASGSAAFIWTARHRMAPLDPPLLLNFSVATAINNVGVAVGQSRVTATGQRRAYMFATAVDLSFDNDGDGIVDEVDTQPAVLSHAFSDVAIAGTTAGAFTTRGNQMLTVTKEQNPDGVRILADPRGGGIPATLTACGGATQIEFTPGIQLVVTCGSVIVKSMGEPANITFIGRSSRFATARVPEGNKLVFDPVTFTITAAPENVSPVMVLIEGKEFVLDPGVIVAAGEKDVSIDIKPGGTPNTINLGSRGAVPVAIFSGPDFDARTVDPASVKLAGAAVRSRAKGALMASFQDVDNDGLLDLVVQVDTRALKLNETDTTAVLTGNTFDGTAIRGVDSVRIVPNRDP